MSEYNAVPSTGKLKLKGVKDGRVEKKKKKKQSPDEGYKVDNSVVLQNLADEDAKIKRDTSKTDLESPENEGDEDVREHLKTEAEKRYDEQRRKRVSNWQATVSDLY